MTMTVTKKQLTFGALIILALIAIGIASTFAVQTYIKSNEAANNDQQKADADMSVHSEAEVATRLEEAKQARTAHEFTKAIAAYTAIRSYYETTGNSEKVADTDITLSLLASEQKAHVPQPKPTLAGEK